MKLRRSLRLGVALGALIGLVATPAHADERADARRHFRAGMDLIGRRRFSEGIAELEAAYAILPHPNVVYNIARAYYDQGDFEHAIVYLRRYTQSDVPDRAEVDAIIARLETRLRGTAVATAPAAPSTTATSAAPPASSTPAAPSASASADPTPTLPADASAQQQALIAAAQQLMRLAGQMQGAPHSQGASSEGTGTAVEAGGAEGPGDAEASGPTRSAPGSREALRGGAGDDAYEERVVTASRVAQSPLDAPNATGVITAQDIRLSGLTSVGELLRRLVGVDVMQLDASDVQVSIRGFNQRMSNKVLVLVDGRSVYLDFMGVTLFGAIPQSVEEIERIEVIRGPGSALYGADAFTGVINIITRAPGENRSSVTLGAGNGQAYRGTFYTSGRQGNIAYRASASYEQRATYALPIDERDTAYAFTTPHRELALRAPRVSLDLSTRLGRQAVLRGGIGIAASSIQFQAIGPLRGYWADTLFAQPYLQLDWSGLTARAFWNHFSGTAAPIISPQGTPVALANVLQDVADLDVQYALRSRFGSVQNTLQAGLNYRMKHISWNYLDADHTLHHFALYLQDTLRLSDRFSAVGSIRMDRHPVLANPVFSPRGSVIFRPTASRAIRVSGGTAFRTPTMTELFLQLENRVPAVPGVSVGVCGGQVADAHCRQLEAESGISVDVGYLDQTFDRVQFEANLFWTRGSNLITLAEVEFAPLGQSDTGTGRAIALGGAGFRNDPTATYVYGAELGTRISPIDGLDIYANYTLALTEHEAGGFLAGGVGVPADQRTPIHKVNAGVQLRTRAGLDAELFAHYASQQVWLEQVYDVGRGIRYADFSVPDYFVLNGRVGYRLLQDRLDLGLVGTNLTDTRVATGHREHPFGTPLALRLMATASYRF